MPQLTEEEVCREELTVSENTHLDDKLSHLNSILTYTNLQVLLPFPSFGR